MGGAQVSTGGKTEERSQQGKAVWSGTKGRRRLSTEHYERGGEDKCLEQLAPCAVSNILQV